MIAWFSKFIPPFSELCEPFYALKRKREKYVRSSEAQKPFELLTGALASPPVFAHPNYSVQFEVYWDGNSVGVCALLAQKDKPLAYKSRIF